MPSLRQKVTTYFRQLSFIAEPREGGGSSFRGTARTRVEDGDDDDGNFITKYLEGRMTRQFSPSPEIHNGQSPSDMPELKIGAITTEVTAACTGPDEGLTGIKRSKLHLSASYADDIDFIDTNQEENDFYAVRKSSGENKIKQPYNKFGRGVNGMRKLSNGTSNCNAAAICGNDQNTNKSTSGGGMRSRKNSKTGIANLVKDTAAKNPKIGENTNKSTTIVVSMISSSGHGSNNIVDKATSIQNDKNLLNGKTDETTKTTATPAKTVNTEDDSRLVKDKTAQSTTLSVNQKLLESATERLLREAVSNLDGNINAEQHKSVPTVSTENTIASVSNWKMDNEYAYGISVSLYENNMLTKEPMGNPIADCYGMVVHGNSAAMAIADGVNWGDGARLAARSAVHGCLDYLDRAIFGLANGCNATTTQDIFVSLLRSLWEGHGCILEVGGALSTLTVAVVLPLPDTESTGQFVLCACNVGDSLGYIYSKKYGVREFTQASHDITSMRDMRDALGAIGPADGNKPELSNLTFSMTLIEHGDIVFLTSDGISDNFDPVVGKFAEAWTSDVKLQTTAHSSNFGLIPKRQNKSASAIYARLHRNHDANVPKRPPRTKKSVAISSPTSPNPTAPSRPKYMRSQTVIEPRRLSSAGNPANRQVNAEKTAPHRIPRSATGLPLVTGPQRHALTLYRLEDLLSFGINGTFSPCVSARRLCHLLIDFVRMITSARRKTLEQRELFYKLSTGPDGIRREVELNRMQHRAARKRIVDSSAFTALPGKLDHATVMAYIVGNESSQGNNGSNIAPLQSKEFSETNF